VTPGPGAAPQAAPGRAATAHAHPEEAPTVTTMTAPPPIPTTGDEAADTELAMLRSASEQIWSAQERINALSRDRMRLVLRLRDRGILFRVIADAIPTTEQTIFKIHRDAKAAQARGEL
jgi:hypothetical protein